MNRLLIVLMLCVFAVSAHAADHRVPAKPGAVLALLNSGAVSAGDRILLADGYHGSLRAANFEFRRSVTIQPDTGARPRFSYVHLQNMRGIVLKGFEVRPDARDLDFAHAFVMVVNGRNMRVEKLTVRSALDTKGWTAAKWLKMSRNGITVSGHKIAVKGNHLRNVRHAITSFATRADVRSNLVEIFAGDGIRGLGDNSEYRDNIIDTCVKIDQNHDDGFQSWSLDKQRRAGRGVIRGVRVINNTIRNGTHPLTCKLQGIGLFDGMYEDWLIKGNTIIVNHWHGITVTGATNVRITGNYVADLIEGRPGPPWISIKDHKNGTPSTGNRVWANKVVK